MASRNDSKRQLERREIFWKDVDVGEILDPTPVELPADAEHPPSIQEEMKRFIREELSKIAVLNGQESFDQADDFDDDDLDEEEDLSDEISRYTEIELEGETGESDTDDGERSEEVQRVLRQGAEQPTGGGDREVEGGASGGRDIESGDGMLQVPVVES